MSQRWIILLLLVMVGLTGWWLEEVDDEQRPKSEEQRHDPDYYMENFIRTEMGETGEPKNQLRARFMQHFPDDDTVELEEPWLEFYKPGGRTWYVNAERGWVTSGFEVVLLYGEVRIWQWNDAGAHSVEIITRDLKVLPEEEYAETDMPTTILTPRSKTTAIGMRAKLQNSKLELLDEVKTHYDPHTPE